MFAVIGSIVVYLIIFDNVKIGMLRNKIRHRIWSLTRDFVVSSVFGIRQIDYKE